ncbi:atrial natriuretic peptide receptor 1-like [Ruditapes philippinarum]|uniref:atrial natriuretic peptide receptor 1-like n=1 Tax=Ruditapes philippinarum TaxID=129788 RepID=UPI00295BBB4C|nr:atrial natriuretic peptide receptor 1-like [Ruditapes philippinarum]
MSKARFTNSISQLSLRSVAGSKSAGDRISDVTDNLQLFSKIGFYKGIVVAIKCLNPQCISLTQTDLHELKAMRDLRNENVNTFIGMCIEECRPCLLTAYCNKGSLEDIIENEDIKLDWLFKVSLINDLTNALYYIHSSPLRYHGNIKSSNCLVDNRWVLKVTDYGLTRMRNLNRRRNLTEYKYYTGMFWTAPELIDNSMQINMGTQKADIYSFSVVLFEILYRRSPYDTVATSPEEIIKRVQAREVPPYRPKNFNDEAEDNIENDWMVGYNTRKRMIQLLNECWSDKPECRPPMSDIRYVTRELRQGRKVNIVDNMVLMLEKYAVNLETIVEQRTAALIEEKQKTDTLLYRMLPTTVAEDLKCGKIVRPEVFENVTIYFSDIVGFTALSSESTPIEIVDFLNDLYSAFDARISQRDVYKVETIGDAYMVVSGLPVRNEHRHAEEIALMSLDLLKCAKEFKIEHRPETILQLRIGINTGPCAAGVVGRTMPRYCLFGDTVNIASRMESTGEAMKIHLSQSAKTALDLCNKFQTEVRGSIEIKGKGSEMTYWLIGSKC